MGGGVEDEDVGEGEELLGGGVLTLPVQATPFMVNAVGTGLLLLFQEPLNPKLAVPFVPTEPLYDMLAAVTCDPLWVGVAFHIWVTVWPAPNDQPTVQLVTGLPRLVKVKFAVKPPDHCELTE